MNGSDFEPWFGFRAIWLKIQTIHGSKSEPWFEIRTIHGSKSKPFMVRNPNHGSKSEPFRTEMAQNPYHSLQTMFVRMGLFPRNGSDFEPWFGFEAMAQNPNHSSFGLLSTIQKPDWFGCRVVTV